MSGKYVYTVQNVAWPRNKEQLANMLNSLQNAAYDCGASDGVAKAKQQFSKEARAEMILPPMATATDALAHAVTAMAQFINRL